MQRFIISFIIVDALHVSGGFSAHHQELNNCEHSIWYVPGLLACQILIKFEFCRKFFSKIPQILNFRKIHPVGV